MKAQGATEYLVLLAVVLIVALISVALLGFFPGMAGDAQATQSKIYWSGASPIAIIESGAQFVANPGIVTNPNAVLYLRIRNNGNYPIRITKILASRNGAAISDSQYYGGATENTNINFSQTFYLAPGAEDYLKSSIYPNGTTGGNSRLIVILPTSFGWCPEPGFFFMCAATSICQNSTSNPGTLVVNDFGFEYIAYIEGQQITKRQVGSKPLVIKCT
jgi:hypothetical protein